MERLTKTIDGYVHGRAGKNYKSMTEKWCRGSFEATAIVEKLAEYEDAEESGLLVRLPCRVGDVVYVDSRTIPEKDLDEEKIPLYFSARVVSIRKNSKGWFLKLSIKAEWLHEWIDDETGPESAYYESKRYFTFSRGSIGKTVFLTQAEAEAKLKEMEGENGYSN